MNSIVTCKQVSKSFRIPVSEQSTLRGRLLHPFSPQGMREFHALDDINFEITEGEFFGIVGRNGSGKSTLLKILAGIYGADTGHIHIGGSLAPFIELGVGFNFELSGRENVFLNGALLGLSNRELRRRYDSIVEFAELEDFMELKLANFSSGMQVRLAFAIAVESNADILLIDEVLAVGDERFQRKCFDVFAERKRSGKTVIFVSHDMSAVMKFCDRALLLEKGRRVELGNSEEVADAYLRLNMPRSFDRDVRYKTGWLSDVRLAPFTASEQGISITGGASTRASVTVTAQRDLPSPEFGFIVTNIRGEHYIASNTAFTKETTAPLTSGEQVVVDFTFDNVLKPGTYLVSATLEDRSEHDPIDVSAPTEFHVVSDHPTGALIEVPHRVRVRAADALVDATTDPLLGTPGTGVLA